MPFDAARAHEPQDGIFLDETAAAQFGFGMLWTLVLTFPLMAVIQTICARIGFDTYVGTALSNMAAAAAAMFALQRRRTAGDVRTTSLVSPGRRSPPGSNPGRGWRCDAGSGRSGR
jgi:hypothetical protein